MEYLISFLEGIITFISPCLLPMLPVYLSYFAGASGEGKGRTLKGAAGFVLGFTAVFVSLGAFAGAAGGFLWTYKTQIDIVSGILVILFGLHFMGVFRLPFLNFSKRIGGTLPAAGFFSAVLFGAVFAVGWTPCVGAFLGTALMLAARGGESVKGILMLLSFSLGLGLPFLISAVLIGRLKSAFDLIKRHYRLVNGISGAFLVVIGLLMAFGYMDSVLSIFAG